MATFNDWLAAPERSEVVLCELEPSLTLVGLERADSYADTIKARSGLVGYWRLGESSGTNAADASGNGHHGTYVNAPTLGAAGAIADGTTAVTFDGVNDEVSVASAALNLTAGPLSVEAWIKRSVGVNDGNIASTSFLNGYSLSTWGDGTAYFQIATGPSIASAPCAIDGAWHHLVGTWDGTTNANGIKIYIDGVLAGQGTAATTILSATGFTIGRDTARFQGSIDEVAVYSRALTAAEVLESYTLRLAPAVEDTPAYQISAPRSVVIAEYPGGLYRPVIGVTQDATALTSRASVPLLEANPGSYYWDQTNELLYIHTTTGAAPSSFTLMQASVRLHLANQPIVLEYTPGVAASAVYYVPWLTDDLPTIHRQIDDLLSGSMAVPTGNVSFINGHAAWYALVASDGVWNWKNRPVRFFIGGGYNGLTLTRTQYESMATMLIEDVAPNEQTCTFALQALQRFADFEIPVTPFFEADYPALGDGVRGTKKWIGYGRTTMRPDLTDTTNFGVYTIADAAFQTLFAVHNVWAIEKATGAWTLLTLTTHYTVNLTTCIVTIVSGTYPHQDFEIAVDVTGKPDGVGGAISTYADIVRDLLTTFLGAAAADLDTASFAQADLEADAELSLWIKSPRILRSVLATAQDALPSLGRSVMGALQQTVDGQWTVAIWNPDIDAITTSLVQKDLAVFQSKPKYKTTFSTIRVFYGYDHARDQWSSVEVTDQATQFRTRSRDALEIYTYLVDESTASRLAERYLLLAGAVTVEATFTERGALLATSEAGSKALVTYSPAPNVAGAYAAQPFEVLEMRVQLAPKLSVAGVFSNLRGLGGRVGQWMDSSAPDWSTATAAQRQTSGFWCDTNGLADPLDPASANQSIWF